MLEICNFDLIPTDELGEVLTEEIEEEEQNERRLQDEFDPNAFLSEATVDAGYDSVDLFESSLLNKILLASLITCSTLIIVLRICFYRVQCINNCL